MKVILHCDLDAFFASVEQAVRPSLQGKPVAISAGRGQGVVTAASYEARNFGVRATMSFTQAQKLCPSLLLLTSRFEAYTRAGAAVQTAISSIAPVLERTSIDECFIDITNHEDVLTAKDSVAGSLLVAARIRELVREQFGLVISIGGASSKVLAKLCTDSAKPNGVRVLAPNQELEFLQQTPIEYISGIGARTSEKLHKNGVTTVGDIQNISLKNLRQLFGPHQGAWLYQLARSDLHDKVTPHTERKSLSVVRTFRTGTTNLTELSESLLGEVLNRLFNSGRATTQVSVEVLVHGDLRRKSRKFQSATSDLPEIAHAARKLLTDIGITTDTAPTLAPALQMISFTIEGLTETSQLKLGLEDFNSSTPELLLPPTPDPDLNLESSAYRGMPVKHPVFGLGTVLMLSEKMVTVKFKDRVRELQLWAPLEF